MSANSGAPLKPAPFFLAYIAVQLSLTFILYRTFRPNQRYGYQQNQCSHNARLQSNRIGYHSVKLAAMTEEVL